MEDEHRIGAGLAEQMLALIERGQAEGRRVGLEIAYRMRIERGDDAIGNTAQTERAPLHESPSFIGVDIAA